MCQYQTQQQQAEKSANVFIKNTMHINKQTEQQTVESMSKNSAYLRQIDTTTMKQSDNVICSNSSSSNNNNVPCVITDNIIDTMENTSIKTPLISNDHKDKAELLSINQQQQQQREEEKVNISNHNHDHHDNDNTDYSYNPDNVSVQQSTIQEQEEHHLL